jgi:CheY-like chemotaxis protein
MYSLMSGFDVHDIITKPLSEEQLVAAVARAGVPKHDRRPILVVDDDPVS